MYLFWLLVLCFYGIPECENERVSGSICVSCTFAWALFLLVLSYSDVLAFVLSCLIYFYPLEVCVFSNEGQKGGASEWKGRWGGTRRSRGKGIIIKTQCMKNRSNF